MKPLEAAARFSGLTLDPSMRTKLDRYLVWLADEGLAAGGLGPAELDRLETRHVADSLLFASQIPPGSTKVWDLGSGVGLPGIPLAIVLPDIDFILVDRSGRRVALLRRVVRILDLANCEVRSAEIEDLEGEIEVIVTRATLPAEQMGVAAGQLLAWDGVVIMGGSWQQRPEHPGWETVEIPREVLDQTIWLLMMRRA